MKETQKFTGLSTVSPYIWSLIALTIVIGLMWPTAISILDIWSTSPTFTHGFFVFPAFLWLVWRKRELIASLDANPDWRALPLVMLLGAIWLVSGLAGIQVGQQVALALIIMSTFWAVAGTDIAKAIQFPILFLFFLAPVGEELVPYLMELTADMTVWAIRMTNIPIYREGLFFSLPSGNWSVVEACSGINYLISSISLGSLYAYLNYTSYKLRLIFMIIAVLLPILANSVRAYIIVMLGHFSGNKLATGVDHLIYGWLFFGIVMFLLFSIGSLFHDPAPSLPQDQPLPSNVRKKRQTSILQKLSLLVAIAVAVGAWPAWSKMIRGIETNSVQTTQQVVKLLPGSTETVDPSAPTATKWQPRISGYDTRLDADYQFPNSKPVQAMAFVYADQRQGKEMISSTNVLVRSQNEDWRNIGFERKRITTASGNQLNVIESHLHSADQQIVVWQWYKVGEQTTTEPLKVKTWELLSKLSLSGKLSTTYVLATHESPNAQSALSQAAEEIESN